ncbi:MAG: SNF2 helicase associated domain-containing protein [Clostridium celatum]|nr:SNF2 helicase associated domain-containing protein [Clostridium celatum]
MKYSSIDNPLDILLQDINKKEEIKIEVYFNKLDYRDSISVEFKIGLKNKPSNKLNVIKDIKQFLIYYENKVPLKFSNDFTFDISKQKISNEDLSLIRYIYDLLDIEKRNIKMIKSYDKLINGKYIYPPKYLMREFFSIVKGSRIYFNDGFFSRPVDAEILETNPKLNISVLLLENTYKISLDEELPILINNRLDIMISGTTIYLPDKNFINRIKSYYIVFRGNREILIDKNEEGRILKELIPTILNLDLTLNLSNNIKEKVILASPEFKFYFDKKDDFYVLDLKVKYDKYEFNIFDNFTEKVIYRDTDKEKSVLALMKSLGFDNINNRFYMTFGDDYIYNFFKYKIHNLQEVGEVFYSENFKGIKQLNSKSIIANIYPGKFNYFELKFDIKNIDEEEINKVLSAFRNKLKYYKLKNGEFLDIEDLQLKNFLRLIDSLDNNKIINNKIEFNKNKALYVNEYLNKYQMKFLKGKGYLRNIKSKFNNIDKLQYELPKNFNGYLRKYQYKGYCFLRTMEELGFGAILADEMGLGKTIQTIAFLSAKKNSNSLIVAPSSLIYNWKSEIEKFAPSLKVAIINGSKEQRNFILKDYKNYDILLTTYTLIKNDIEDYLKISFNYVILDEAQYIKNSNSQNSRYIKMINSDMRIALTGTPIENSTLELWSIFDFIMPGYLYDEDTFTVKYHRKLNESKEVLDELQRLINPFILRRYKKDVAIELPPKIEKIIKVELPNEQKRVYNIYSKKVLEIVEKKIKDDEFNNGKIEILSYITKLRQLVLDPTVILNDYIGENGKLEVLVELLHKSINEGHKILVFSQFTTVLKNIKERLKYESISYSYLDGTISSKKREEIINEFNNEEKSVFLISLKAGGIGLNLQNADIVIHFDPWWNPAIEDQATDRSHRIGQKNVVEVIKLIANDTIEEKINLIQNKKKSLINSILNNDNLKENTILNLNEEDILDLFK